VLDYDEEEKKYLVKVMETGVEKWVGRLSVMFMWEDPVRF